MLLKLLCIFPENRLNVFLYIKPSTVSEMLRTNENKSLVVLFFVARNWLRIIFPFVKDIDRDFTKFCIWNREHVVFLPIN